MNNNNKQIFCLSCLVLVMFIVGFSGCINNAGPALSSGDWCIKQIRPELKLLNEKATKRKWFRVYDIGESVYAIMEPYNYQEVISYLILGHDKALLFDTGMGLDSISLLVKELTPLPVTVLNSHTHYDHIGGNHEFSDILAMNTAFTVNNAANGYSHQVVKQEVSPEAFCMERLPNTDTTNYSIKLFKISKLINDGFVIDLGERKIEVMAVPGHTPDAIALRDSKNGYLWTGDTFYQGPIWLFSETTDLVAYGKSIAKLAALTPGLKKIFPSHNIPVVAPQEIVAANQAFIQIRSGVKKGKPDGDKSLSFDFGKFSFLIRKDFLQTHSKH